MYFWLKDSRFLAVKFAIQEIELFFYLFYNVHSRVSLVRKVLNIFCVTPTASPTLFTKSFIPLSLSSLGFFEE